MSYQTLEGINHINFEQLFADGNPGEIFEKKKEYYQASADKIRARLILARTRISSIKLKESNASYINHKISKGIRWLDKLKMNIESSQDEQEFQHAISYKQWHLVKLIPQAAEGCALSCFLEEQLKNPKNSLRKNNMENINEAGAHNQQVRNLLIEILNSDENNNLVLQEEQLSEAYEKLNLAYKALDKK